MRISTLKSLSIAFALVLGLIASAKPAHADSLTATYFTIAASDKDANNLGAGLVTNEVQATLGIHGLPVLNTAAYGCVTGCFTLKPPTDVLADGEITYWSPTLNNGTSGGTSDVTQTLVTGVTLPFSDDTLFAPNGTGSCDGASCGGFQALLLSGTLTAPTDETIGFSISSDDMAFAYLDGNLVCSDGGIHGEGPVPCTTPGTIAAGDHTFKLFFVDLNTVASALDFSITTAGVTTSGGDTVPEPSAFVLLGTGLIGAAGAFRRRFSR